jgi:ATP-dependent Clp protease ATP-binding subunit ClpA
MVEMKLQNSNGRLTRAASTLILLSLVFVNVIGVYADPRANAAVSEQLKTPALKKFTTDLTQLAAQKRLGQNSDFEFEVNRIIQILAGGDSRQPLIMDETGESLELVAEQVAVRLNKGGVPASLSGKRLLKLEIEGLFDDAKTEAEASVVIESLITELTAAKGRVILFIDELENFVDRRQINEKLTGALKQGLVRIIGGTSKPAYAEKIEPLAEAAALFTPIIVGQNKQTETTEKTAVTFRADDFRGDNVAADLRSLMTEDSSGQKRINAILQAKSANDASLRELM